MELPKRKQNRLKGYDYSSNGAYFITICVKDKQCVLWSKNVGATCGRPLSTNVQDNNTLSKYGIIIDTEINKIDNIYEQIVVVDKYVIMPNHIHMILIVNNMGNGQCNGNGRPKVAPTLSRVIQGFKGSISKQVGFSLWQKSFHDRIIRNEKEYQKIWEYIDTNPMKWEIDCFNPQNQSNGNV